MSFEEMLAAIAAIFMLGGIVLAANYADRTRSARIRLSINVVLILINVLLVLNGVLQVVSAYSSLRDDFDPSGEAAAWGALLVSLIMAGLATALLFSAFRERIAIFFPRFQGKLKHQPDMLLDEGILLQSQAQGKPLFPQMLNYYTTDSAIGPPIATTMSSFAPHASDVGMTAEGGGIRGFNPASMVHMVALAFCVYFLGIQFMGFVLEGGLEGVAEDYSEGLSAWDILINGIPLILISILGVGIGLRRNLSQSLKRLGLELPTLEGVGMAFLVTIGLFIFLIIVGVIWQGLVSEETFEEQNQASEALSDSINTLGMAFLISITAAVGEEIAFRGALQPVLGLWPTAIIFALFHLQYTLTPATLIILGVAVAFGWLRFRYNTTVAMIAHFAYNFIQLSIAVLYSEEAISLFGHLLR